MSQLDLFRLDGRVAFVPGGGGAIGSAMATYDSALGYSKSRIQFGKPIAAFQITQEKLAHMVTEITKGLQGGERIVTSLDRSGVVTGAAALIAAPRPSALAPEFQPASPTLSRSRFSALMS